MLPMRKSLIRPPQAATDPKRPYYETYQVCLYFPIYEWPLPCLLLQI
jgi:hypothetical protein